MLADIDENNLYFLFRDLRRKHPDLAVHAQVVDIRDALRVEQLLGEYRPHDVVHAAAHKHVPLMEYAPEEAVKNNVLGCLNLVRAADRLGVERFVLVSTDKAVNPTSVMGATKRVAELLLQHHAARSRTCFSTVRFGNVLGSAGSVVPLFKEQIARGGPVTVTHAECRRYLMTIPEAVGLVLLAGLGGHGELLILEMGEPIRILDLARMMISLSGHVPDKDISIVISGLRPGEKLDEELMSAEEAAASREIRPKVRAVQGPPPPADLLESVVRLETWPAAGTARPCWTRSSRSSRATRRRGRRRASLPADRADRHAELAPVRLAAGPEGAGHAEPQGAGRAEVEPPLDRPRPAEDDRSRIPPLEAQREHHGVARGVGMVAGERQAERRGARDVDDPPPGHPAELARGPGLGAIEPLELRRLVGKIGGEREAALEARVAAVPGVADGRDEDQRAQGQEGHREIQRAAGGRGPGSSVVA